MSTLTVSRPFLTPGELKTLRAHTTPNLKVYLSKRRLIISLLRHIIRTLKFPLQLLHTAMTYYQHYYLHHRFSTEHHVDVGLTCLFLASKTCDTIKKLRDILVVAQSSSEDGTPLLGHTPSTELLDEGRRRVMHWEKRLLEVMSFDFRNNVNCLVSSFLVKFLKLAVPDGLTVVSENFKFLSYVITFDVVRTDLSLLYPSHVIALACMRLGACLEKVYQVAPGALSEAEKTRVLQSIDTLDIYGAPQTLVRGAYKDLLQYYSEGYAQSHLARYAPESLVFHDLMETAKGHSWSESREPDRYLQSITEVGTDSRQDTPRDGLRPVSKRFMLGNNRKRFTAECTGQSDRTEKVKTARLGPL